MNSQELLIPSILPLLKIANTFIERMNQGEEISQEKIEENIRKVVIEYSKQAWKDRRTPLYPFDSKWQSPELEHDLDVLFRRQWLTTSKPKLAEGAVNLLDRYEKMDVFSDYFKTNIEKRVGFAVEKLRKEGQIKQK